MVASEDRLTEKQISNSFLKFVYCGLPKLRKCDFIGRIIVLLILLIIGLYFTSYFTGSKRFQRQGNELKYETFYRGGFRVFQGNEEYDFVNSQVVSENFHKNGFNFGIPNRKGNPKAGGWYINTSCPRSNIILTPLEGINNAYHHTKVGNVYGYLNDCYYIHNPPLPDWLNFIIYSIGIDNILKRKLFYFTLSLIGLLFIYIIISLHFNPLISKLSILIYILSPLFEIWADNAMYYQLQMFFLVSAILVKTCNFKGQIFTQSLLLLLQSFTGTESIITHSLLFWFVLVKYKGPKYYALIIPVISYIFLTLLKILHFDRETVFYDFLNLIESHTFITSSKFINSVSALFDNLYNSISYNIITYPLLLSLPFVMGNKSKMFSKDLAITIRILFLGPVIFQIIFLEYALIHQNFFLKLHDLFFIFVFATVTYGTNNLKNWKKFIYLIIFIFLLYPRAIFLQTIIKDRIETFKVKDFVANNENVLAINYWHPRNLESYMSDNNISTLTDSILPHAKLKLMQSFFFKVLSFSKIGESKFDIYLYRIKKMLSPAFVVDKNNSNSVVLDCNLFSLDRANGKFSALNAKKYIIHSVGNVFLKDSHLVVFEPEQIIVDVIRVECNVNDDFNLYEVIMLDQDQLQLHL